MEIDSPPSPRTPEVQITLSAQTSQYYTPPETSTRLRRFIQANRENIDPRTSNDRQPVNGVLYNPDAPIPANSRLRELLRQIGVPRLQIPETPPPIPPRSLARNFRTTATGAPVQSTCSRPGPPDAEPQQTRAYSVFNTGVAEDTSVQRTD